MNFKVFYASAALTLSALASLLSGQAAVAQPSLVGVFAGSIELTAGTPRTIPLEISLSLSEETETVETANGPEQRRVIDAAFNIDDEGGPYTFTKVTYDLDLNILDLRYSRNLGESENRPAAPSVRFTGKFNDDGSIEGKVVSGSYGVIGTFKLQKTNATFLVQRQKYNGVWTAKPDWTTRTFGINLNPSLADSINPAGMELGYTPGKVGSFRIDGDLVNISFNRVSIDYIRQRALLTSVGQDGVNVSLDCIIVPVTYDLDCTLATVFGGNQGRAYFQKVK